MKNYSFKRLLSSLLTFTMLLGLAVVPVSAADPASVRFEKTDNRAVTAHLPFTEAIAYDSAETYGPDDVVRASIVLDRASTIAAGFATEGIAQNAEAMAYRETVEAYQAKIANAISAIALDGQALDIVWNLTLAADIISANIPFGRIEAILGVDGVSDVVIETVYAPAVYEKNEIADPNMSTSPEQIGSSAAWASGYTGAGSRIAVIDTGLDLEHISFDADAFDHALALEAEAKGLSPDAYLAELDLLDEAEISASAEQLHVKDSGMYYNTKVPFLYNYIDKDTNVSHVKDAQSEHGSHVSGIAAANRFIETEDGSFVSALDSVLVQGVAPDAQLMVMKVFGVNGGAYDSDYMAAMEDAIVLGADSINLSLGSPSPGLSYSADKVYQTILDKLTETDTVVSISAGNSGYWAEKAAPVGFPYYDGVSFDMVGSPGSYRNSLSVASVDNIGFTGSYFSVADTMYFYTESPDYGNAPLASIAGEYEYLFLDGVGTEEQFAAVADVLEGKIAVCSRGETSFFEKANAAVSNGAAATIIYNNQDGVIGLNLTGYEHEAPCVSILQSEGASMKAAAEPVADEEGNVLYYIGKITIGDKVGVTVYDAPYKMSEFSSWGVPGSLELKPEITAPGGNIYSVNGRHSDGSSILGGIDAYEQMSGTSMAAPQISGMAALVAQYIRENKLDETTGQTVRALSQSLLMSTAVPMVEAGENPSYYPVLRQGAGLARVDLAVTADSYILMGEDATAAYADGKVKAELGDDPSRAGTYAFSFSVNNLTDEDQVYDLSAAFFTQTPVESYTDASETNTTIYLHTSTMPIDASVVFTADGQEVEQIAVPAGGSATVSVEAALTEETRAFFETNLPAGAYVEGYVFAEEPATDEGVEGTCHSIPVLAFYGNFTDAPMFDIGSYVTYATGEETRMPYMAIDTANGENAFYENALTLFYADDPGTAYYFGGNPVIPDAVYLPERNAVNASDALDTWYFTPVRNAEAFFTVSVNGEAETSALGTVGAPYYYPAGDVWKQTQQKFSPSLDLGSFEEGTEVELSLTLAPECYLHADGTPMTEMLGAGAFQTYAFTIDNTAPVIADVTYDAEAGTLTVTASDNNYVAAILMFNAGGEDILAQAGAVQETEAGAENAYVIDVSAVNGSKFLIQAMDYAANITTFTLEADIFAPDYVAPDMMAFDLAEGSWRGLYADKALSASMPLSGSDLVYTAAANIGGRIFAATKEGDLYLLNQEELSESTYLASLGMQISDMSAYGNVLFALSNGVIYAIDPASCDVSVIAELADFDFETNTLACAPDGSFWCIEYSTGDLYNIVKGKPAAPDVPDIDGDNDADKGDVQALLDYAVGKTNEAWTPVDIDGDDDIDTHDAYVYAIALMTDAPYDANLVAKTGYTMSGVQSIEADPETGLLYWTRYLYNAETETAESTLVSVNPADGTVTSAPADPAFADQLSALVFAEPFDESLFPETDTVDRIELSEEQISIIRGSQAQLQAVVLPWTVSDASVTWMSSDPSVASVDENGVVTAVSVGTASVTAVSVLDETVTASCEVNVMSIDKTLNGFVWDADGKVWWSEIETGKIPAYNPIAEAKLPFASAAVGADGRLFAATLDTENNVSGYYEINPADYTETLIGNSEISYTDMAFAPNIGLMFSVYGPYIVIIDDTTGGYLGAFEWSSSANLVGIAYYGSIENTNYGKMVDMFLLIDENGVIYVEGFMEKDGKYYNFNGQEEGLVLDTGLAVDVPVFQSAYYDGTYLFWTRFVQMENKAEMMAVDIDNTGKIYHLGDFGDGIWPVSGLFESAPAETPETAWVSALRDAEISGTAAASVVRTSGSAMNRSTIYAADAKSMDDIVIDDTADQRKITVTIYAKDAEGNPAASFNGLADVAFDPAVMKFVSAEFNGMGSYLAEEGHVKVSYLNTAGIDAEEAAVVLTFTAEKAAVTKISVTTLETDNEHLSYTEEFVHNCEHKTTETRGYVAPTCTGTGYSGDIYCMECGTLISKGTVLGALGHNFVDGVCTRCGATAEPQIPDPEPDPEPVIPVCPSEKYTDVPEKGHWAHEGIDYVLANKLFVGTTDTTFSPDMTTTRGMLAVVLWRMAGEPVVNYAMQFDDVAPDAYYAEAVRWAASEGIVNGDGAGSFNPDDVVTREQLAAMLRRYAAKQNVDTTVTGDLAAFPDAKDVSVWAADDLTWAVSTGLVNGTVGADGVTKLSPAGDATRAQMAAIIMRFAKLTENK